MCIQKKKKKQGYYWDLENEQANIKDTDGGIIAGFRLGNSYISPLQLSHQLLPENFFLYYGKLRTVQAINYQFGERFSHN